MLQVNIIAIDCGLEGAFAALHPEFAPEVGDLPVMSDEATKWIDGRKLLTLLNPHVAYGTIFVIERLQAMPKNGSIASFSMGITFGSLLVAVQQFDKPMHLVHPRVWKRKMGLSGRDEFGEKKSDTKRKHESLFRARELFPQLSGDLTRVKDHNRAEALLLAHYWREYRVATEEWPA